MLLIDSFSDFFGLGGTESNSTDETSIIDTEQAQPVADFASLLTMFSAGESSTGTSSDEGISQMQSQLMSSLGLAGLGMDTLTDMVSDDNLASMQSTFLTMLQADLFSTGSTTDSATESTDIAATVEDGESTWDAFKNYGFGSDGFGWTDGFDTVNLLNHIPIVSDVYQAATSTDISAISDLAGSFLFGGPVGLAYSAVDLGVKGMTGDSITGNLWALGDEWLFEEGVVSETESLAQAVGGETGEAAASSAYNFARRQFDSDDSTISGNE